MNPMSEILQYGPNYVKTQTNLNASLKFFMERMKPGMTVMELGTRKWGANSTHHKALFESPLQYSMVDITPGEDVDYVIDAHELSWNFEKDSYDAIWASSVWEHLHSPWIAAEELLAVLKPGGIFFIQTHQTFPLHGYPHDYFRFSTQALDSLFKTVAKSVSSYEMPCKIIPGDPNIDWNSAAESYLNVCIAGQK